MAEHQGIHNISAGQEGERIAAVFLKNNGYRILERNYRCPIGEIDIVAREKNDLVFVEVKARKTSALGYPEQAVGYRKQRKMSQLALWYIQEKKMHGVNARFDVVAVRMMPSGPDVKLIRDAFEFVTD
jgi:putative endonuclease